MCNDMNILINGFCGTPGLASGKVFIWNKNKSENFRHGDIILLLPNDSSEIPLSYISNAGGIISCRHTIYSHLVSATMAFNIPCIVGAEFSILPHQFQYVTMDALTKWVVFDSSVEMKDIVSRNCDVFKNISSAISAPMNKPLMHLYSLKEAEEYLNIISGLFIDSNIFMNSDQKDILESISKIYYRTNLKVYYRFSNNPAILSDMGMESELKFVNSLMEEGVNLLLFFPNATRYNDIKLFKNYIFQKFSKFMPIKIGSMIENLYLMKDLELILNEHLIDFAVIGMNDLLSSVLSLERDDATNGTSFSIENPKVSCVLQSISQKLNKYLVPYYISYPKFNRFLDDYSLLKEAGYNDFFGSLSLFKIIQSY